MTQDAHEPAAQCCKPFCQPIERRSGQGDIPFNCPFFAVFYLEQGRGVPWMFGVFVLFVVMLNYALARTQWGRSMFAVGGNVEAARLASAN